MEPPCLIISLLRNSLDGGFIALRFMVLAALHDPLACLVHCFC